MSRHPGWRALIYMNRKIWAADYLSIYLIKQAYICLAYKRSTWWSGMFKYCDNKNQESKRMIVIQPFQKFRQKRMIRININTYTLNVEVTLALTRSIAHPLLHQLTQCFNFGWFTLFNVFSDILHIFLPLLDSAYLHHAFSISSDACWFFYLRNL